MMGDSASPVTCVYCIRHGETDWNATGRWQGRAPVPLNAAGLAQSEVLGRWLAEHGVHFSALYSSPNARAWQTAQAVAAPQGLQVVADDRLQEVDCGHWQGLTRDEVAAWAPQEWERWRADWYNVAPPNGESRKDLKARVHAAFDAITARHTGQTVGLVSHGGSLGMLIESLFGKIERPSLTNTSLTIMAQHLPSETSESSTLNTDWVLVKVAWIPHLDVESIGETW